MKKLISLSLISLSLISFISIAQVWSKSPTISVSSNHYKAKTILISADPKPLDAHVNFTTRKAGKGTLVVVDESGITVLKQQVMLVAGNNKITNNNISRLNEGNYSICLNTSNKTYSTAFVLWK